LRATSHMSYGMVHGLFKIETFDGEKSMFIQAKRNNISNQCFIMMDKKVLQPFHMFECSAPINSRVTRLRY